MPSIVWPAALPEMPTIAGTILRARRNVIRTPVSEGPAKVRKRGSCAPRIIPERLILTYAQLTDPSPNGFIAFLEEDTQDGSLEFEWEVPDTGETVTMRFYIPPDPEWVYLGGDNWEVTFTVEVFP